MGQMILDGGTQLGRVHGFFQRGRSGAPVVLIALVLLIVGCSPQRYSLTVEVPIKPKFAPPGNIKEFAIANFEGPAECASDLQKGIHAKAVNAGDFVPTIPGLPDLDGPLEVKGIVDSCSMRMGYGVLNARMQLWHGGKQLYQEVVKEETNRPGASAEEVRTTLVDRAVKMFAGIFVSGKRSEIREGRPRGASDPWWVAATQKHWPMAIESLTTRITAEPKDAPSWYNRGLAHEGKGESREAVADYKKAVELDGGEFYVQALVRAEKVHQHATAIKDARTSRE